MRFFLLISLFILFFSSFSQNLVPNPSFEDTIVCPEFSGEINKADGWSAFRPSPDYFNFCSNNNDTRVPNNSFGYQCPATGKAYIGFYTYSWVNPNGREHLGQQLIAPLEIGTKYYLSMKVNLSNKINCATNKIGTLFSTVLYDNINPSPVNNFAHIYTSTIITDTVNWTTVSGSFIADSAYNYIIIGNFFDGANTDTIIFNGNPPVSYYFIDDICVSADSQTCNTDVQVSCIPTSEQTEEIKDDFNVYLNQANSKLFIETSMREDYIFVIYDILGKTMKYSNKLHGNIYVDLYDFPSGIFFITIHSNTVAITKKLLLLNNF